MGVKEIQCNDFVGKLAESGVLPRGVKEAWLRAEELDKMRLAAELDQGRFLLRLKPYKVEVQRGLLERRGFPPDAAGLAQMERAVAAHMADAPEVGKRAKALMIQLMGDIWDEHVYGRHVS